MKLRTSSFNKTVFKKNMIRFAPAWLLYTLCLLLGMVLMYTNDSGPNTQNFWFASRMGSCVQYLSLVNLFWAPLAAMLLFGDLFNSRMCNALHAMPIRRECFFVTNVVSGLAFSALPTFIMALCALPLLVQTCVVDAWQIAFWFFLGTNLSYICFFGIAVFSAFCVGSRFSMGLVYALINGGAFLAYWLVDTLYTPMFYGVITPERLSILLTPIANMLDTSFVEVESYMELRELFAGRLEEMTASYWLTENWGSLVAYALAGVVFAAIGLLLYRGRDLECAGDMVAFKVLEPVFVVLFAVFGATAAQFMVYLFLGSRGLNNLFLAAGLVAGWFAGKMLVARSTHVFRFKNWLGLAALSAVVALSLAAAHFDVFGIEDWMPKAENVESATIGLHAGDWRAVDVTQKEDIENLIRLHEIALVEKRENSGSYPEDETATLVDGKGWCTPDGEKYEGEFYSVSGLYITYHLENGRKVQRYYKIRVDDEVRTLVSEYLSRWESISVGSYHFDDGVLDLDNLHSISIHDEQVPKEYVTRQDVEALMAAIRADCEARNMTQNEYFHNGHFYGENEEGNPVYSRTLWLSIHAENSGFSVNFYADSENVLRWCRERNLLNQWTVSDKNIYGG